MTNALSRARAMSGSFSVHASACSPLRSRKAATLEFERDYTALLFSLSIAVRCGLDPLQALLLSEELFEEGSAMRGELGALKDRIDRGMPEDAAIDRFGQRFAHPDLPLFRSAFVLARKHGGSLSDSINRLARVTRQRQSFRRRSQAALAGQRLSAYGIAASALAVGVMQGIASRQALIDSLEHPVGRVMLSGALAISLAGFAGMIWTSRVRI